MRNIIAIIALALLTPTLLAGGKSTPVADINEQNRRKAEYLFMEAQTQKMRGNMGAFYDLTRRAYDLDSNNTIIAYYLGYCHMLQNQTTRAQAEDGLRLMSKHVNACPLDYFENTFYADACVALDKSDEALKALKALSESDPNNLELQLRLAEGYLATRQFREAVALYDTIDAREGKSMEVTMKKVGAYQALNDTLGALKEMRELIASAPRNAFYNIALASMYQQFAMNDSALVCLDRAQTYEPDNGYTYLAKAQFYETIGDSAAYEQQITRALTSKDLDVESKVNVLVSYIREALQAGDSTKKAGQLLDVLVEQHPHEVQIHSLYSEYLVANKDYAGAAEQLGYVLDIDPTASDAWRRLMIVNILGENYPAAIKAAEKALEYNPDSIELYSYIAPTYFQIKEYDKALKTYNMALARVDSADIDMRSDLIGGKGDVYFELGDTARAFEAYDQALELNPGNTSILNNYAYFLAESNLELDKAESMAAKAVNANPQNATFIDTYAWVFYKKGDYAMALLYIKNAIAYDPSPSAEIHDHYGDILAKNDKLVEAVEEWSKALDAKPDNPEAIQQKIDAAIAEVERMAQERREKEQSDKNNANTPNDENLNP